MIIATHNGTFHADETTACAILTYLFENSSIIRSRDPEELEKQISLLMFQIKMTKSILITILKNLL